MQFYSFDLNDPDYNLLEGYCQLIGRLRMGRSAYITTLAFVDRTLAHARAEISKQFLLGHSSVCLEGNERK